MKRITLLLITLLLTASAFAQQLKITCAQLNQLNTAILTGSISKPKAAIDYKQLIADLKNSSPAMQAHRWVFPLKGYTAHAIGGYKGNGYSAKGYHFLDGNKHAAHPAHDLFIEDKNQDGLDDPTHHPVNVLAVTGGIVIACTNQWQPGSSLRGGKYIWLYHPQLNMLTYYAHSQAVFVQPGDIVTGGQKIAEVGRTGTNAYQQRSPTHLHFSAYHLVNGLPVPFNCYPQLIHSQFI